MKKALFFLVLTSLLVSPACKKGACIEGVILDSKTNKPVSSARLDLYYEYSELGSLKTGLASVNSNQSGQFSFENDEKYSDPIYIIDVQHAAYGNQYSQNRTEDGCAHVTIKLPPLDGLLELRIINETGTHDTIFAGVYNKCDYRSFFYSGVSFTTPPALTLKQGEQFAQTFRTCAGDSSAVVWRFDKYGSWVGVDSFWVDGGNTLFREIRY